MLYRVISLKSAWFSSILVLAFCSGCSDDKNGTTSGTPPTLPAGCDALVSPGDKDQETVQQALIEVKAGQTLCLASGAFKFSSQLDLAAGGVTVKGAGMDATILDFTGQSVGANGLAITSDDVVVEDFAVKNTAGDGIRAQAVKNITMRNLRVSWDKMGSTDNGAYGLYPVQCEGVRVEGCVVSGASDVGIYVGQSKNIVIAKNEAFGNVAGIESENSFDADVRENKVHDNAGGILVLNLPELPQLGGERSKVHDNIIENNNAANFAEMGTIAAQIPPGTGMLVLAADNNEVHNNTIRGNVSTGILVVSYQSMLFGMFNDANYDIFSQSNWIHDNTFSNNGTDPKGLIPQLIPTKPVPDLLWDGCVDPAKPNMMNALTNCVSGNGTAKYLNFDLCGGGANASPDATAVTCEHMALPAIP